MVIKPFPNYIFKMPKRGLGPEWFVYHETRGTLALWCVFMMKFGLKNRPGKDFGHTKLDADYASLLHYADGLATNETSGNMADMCEWLYGGSKRMFSTGSLDAALPTHAQLRVEAYQKWESDGRTHGHDKADWFWAKKTLAARWWEHPNKPQVDTNFYIARLDGQFTFYADRFRSSICMRRRKALPRVLRAAAFAPPSRPASLALRSAKPAALMPPRIRVAFRAFSVNFFHLVSW